MVDVSILETVLAEDAVSTQADGLGSLSEFLEPVDSGRWRFSQQLVREVAYESLPYRRRTELHARTAVAIERIGGGDDGQQAELLSLHCFHGARYDAAWRYSRVAARSALARYANAEAADSYRRAAAAAPHVGGLEPSELAEVDEALGDIYVELGELAAADGALRRALALVGGTPSVAARLQLKVARLREISGRHTASLHWVQRTNRSLEGTSGKEVSAIRGQLAARQARIRYRQGRHVEALESANAAIALAREGSDRRTLAEALEYADLASVELGSPAGIRAEEALGIYEELGDVGAEARVHNTLGLLAYHQGRWPAALEQYRLAENAYIRCGRPWAATISLANGAEILVDQGRLTEARDAIERAMRVWRGVDAAANVAFGEYQLARVAARSGSLDEAMRRFDAARDHFRAAGELTEVVIVDALAAECLCLAERHAEALALVDATLARANSLGGVTSATPLLLRVRGTALLALARPDEAMAAFSEGLAAARSRGAGHEVAFTLSALVESGMANDPPQEAAWRSELTALAGGLGIAI